VRPEPHPLAQTPQVVPGARRAQDRAWLERLEREGPPPTPTSAHPALYEGMALFNRGRYWDAHEVWETAWRETPYPLRLFYHGLIHLAVALHHLGRGNLRGARAQAGQAERMLRPFSPAYLGVGFRPALDALLAQVDAGEARPSDTLPRLSLALGPEEGSASR